MDRLCALSLCAADEALQAAGELPPAWHEVGRPRMGVVFGSAYGCHATDEAFERGRMEEGPSPRLFMYTLPSSPAGEIAIQYGLRGPAVCMVPGRTAAVSALAEAQRALLRGRAELMLCCAAEVGSPLLERLEGPGTVDGAAALLLGMPGTPARLGHLGPPCSVFHDGAPERAVEQAARQVLARAGQVPELVLGEAGALASVRGLGCSFQELGSSTSASVLAALGRLALGHHAAVLVVASDPRGHGAAVLWLR